MKESFKKLALASAVSAGVGGFAGTADALILGEPGNAILVPYVICDTAGGDINNQINTLVGLTTSANKGLVSGRTSTDYIMLTDGLHTGQQVTNTDFDSATTVNGPDWFDYLTSQNNTSGTAANEAYGADRNVHWYFFNADSQKILDGRLPGTTNDFIRFDWCGELNADPANLTAADGVPGYLVFSTEAARTGITADFAMWAQAFQIKGNWASQAFIPSVPMADAQDGPVVPANGGRVTNNDHVTYTGLFPDQVSPSITGIGLTNRDGQDNDVALWSMRYFLDPALASANTFVLWFDRNCANPIATTFGGDGCDRRTVGYESFDSEENFEQSGTIDLSKELNLIRATPTATVFSGLTHSETEAATGATVVNTGLIFFRLPEYNAGLFGGSNADDVDISNGVFFTLLELGAGAVADQTQTELAQERGISNTP